MSNESEPVFCDIPHCKNPATYELEWQDGNGFSSVTCCDEHFPTDPEILKCYCNIRKINSPEEVVSEALDTAMLQEGGA